MAVSKVQGGVAINPATLAAARSRVSLSPEDAARRATAALKQGRSDATLTASDIQALERGDILPTVSEAEALARVCFIRYIDLFTGELPARPMSDFRRPVGAASDLSYTALERIDLFDRLYEITRRVTARLSDIESVALPAKVTNAAGEPDLPGIATATRAALNVDAARQSDWDNEDAALSGWIGAIDDIGVSVFRFSMPIEEIRGMSRWEHGGPAAIALNTADSPTGQMFTLHHEIGHLILGSGPGTLCDPHVNMSRKEERTANAFAAEVLVPAAELRAAIPDPAPQGNFRDWPSALRSELRGRFHVSSAVIGIRLKDLGLTIDSGYAPCWRKQSGIARGRNRPSHERYRRYLGRRSTNLIRQAFADEQIPLSEIARTLGLKASDVEMLAGS